MKSDCSRNVASCESVSLREVVSKRNSECGARDRRESRNELCDRFPEAAVHWFWQEFRDVVERHVPARQDASVERKVWIDP